MSVLTVGYKDIIVLHKLVSESFHSIPSALPFLRWVWLAEAVLEPTDGGSMAGLWGSREAGTELNTIRFSEVSRGLREQLPCLEIYSSLRLRIQENTFPTNVADMMWANR